MTKNEHTKHKQVSIYNPMFKESIEVDGKLAELLQLTWDLGVGTEHSCQDRGGDKAGMAEIHFFTVGQAERFINIVLQFVPKIINFENARIYQRIIQHGCKRCWVVSTEIQHLDKIENVREVYLSASVLFPTDDITEAVTALKQAELYMADDGGAEQ